MRKMVLCAAAVAIFTSTASMADWSEACRDEVFKQNAFAYEVFPDQGAANQKPWLPYCEGYLQGLFESLRASRMICVPEGTKVYKVLGAVTVWFNKKASLEEQRAPGLVAFNAWQDAFPCKGERAPK